MKRRSDQSEAGFVLVIVGISTMVLTLVLGFAVDLGSWYLRASKLQRATDAAALAGASVLPDQERAADMINQVYLRNGLKDGADNVHIVTTITNDSIKTNAQDTRVKIFFARFLDHLSIQRASEAQYSGSAPQLGSPFNVLGTGDLQIGNLPKQNYWLAINGVCSPKEDGDFFSAKWDHNKGPFTSALDANNNFIPAPNALTRCPAPPWDSDLEKNPDWDQSGYSYYVDVPKPSTPGGYVDLKVYDPAYEAPGAGMTVSGYPDLNLNLPADQTWSWGDISYNVWNTNGTPDDMSDDKSMLSAPYGLATQDAAAPHNQWWTLRRLTASEIGDGGVFRIQVAGRSNFDGNPWNIGWFRGVNSFAIGAFASWESGPGCDSRTDEKCPRVYGQDAMSVYTNLTSVTQGNTIPFYFARIDPSYVGKTVKLQLWDPGEGVQKIQILAPDGTPMKFDWSASPVGSGLQGTNATELVTNGIENPSRPNVSNPYEFNDRLVSIDVAIPENFPDLVAHANGDNYLRLAYTVDTAKGDRTTWGMQLEGGSSGAPRLTRLQ